MVKTKRSSLVDDIYGKIITVSLPANLSLGLYLFVLILQCSCVRGYSNYSVGESLGWYHDQLGNPNVDYQRSADSVAAFSLGDFLVFNTDNNYSVIQTYNATVYSDCDNSAADTVEWSAANPSSTAPQPVSVAVPLVTLGSNYFFSGDYDGVECLNGQRFEINVTYGQGLPPSLRAESPAPAAAETGGDESVPDIVVPANFGNPKDVNDEGDRADSNSGCCLGANFNIYWVELVLVGFWFVIRVY